MQAFERYLHSKYMHTYLHTYWYVQYVANCVCDTDSNGINAELLKVDNRANKLRFIPSNVMINCVAVDKGFQLLFSATRD